MAKGLLSGLLARAELFTLRKRKKKKERMWEAEIRRAKAAWEGKVLAGATRLCSHDLRSDPLRCTFTVPHYMATKSDVDPPRLRSASPYDEAAQLEAASVSCFGFKDVASSYESSGQPGVALGKPLGGVHEPNQPRCGNTVVDPRLRLTAGVVRFCTAGEFLHRCERTDIRHHHNAVEPD